MTKLKRCATFCTYVSGVVMHAVSYTYLRQNLKEVLDRVADQHDSLIVTRKNGENMVILSQNDFQALEETVYLMSSPKNLDRLRTAIHNSETGNVVRFDQEVLSK